MHLCKQIAFLIVFSINILYGTAYFGQSKKVRKCLDTIQTRENEYLNSYDVTSFNGISEIQDKIDPLNINQSLLDAAVFFEVNAIRKKLKKSILNHSQKLYKCALMYTKLHSSRFFDDSKDNVSAKTIINYAASKFNYECALLEVNVSFNSVMDIDKNATFHFDKRDYEQGKSEYGLFHGPLELKYDTTHERKEIEYLTFKKFAVNVSNQYLRMIKKEKKKHHWTEGSCSVMIDKKTLFTHKLPSAKIIFIFAKKRTALLPVET
jgi:hypothetical protein